MTGGDGITMPCAGCGRAVPAEREGALILGQYVGGLCDECRPAFAAQREAAILRERGVPEHFVAKLSMMAKRPLPTAPLWTLIQGPVGAGKTHLAIEYARSLDPRRVLFIDWRLHLEARREAMDTKSPDPAPAVRRFIGLVIADDVGGETPTAWAAEAFGLLIVHRHNEELPLMVTTNLDAKALQALYGERVASRIAGAARVVRVTGADRRTPSRGFDQIAKPTAPRGRGGR